MKIKDIVNREIVNLTNCDQEPIHIPGSIQPHGFLIALDAWFVVNFCSGNCTDFIGVAPAQLLGKALSEVLGQTTDSAIKKYAADSAGNATPPLLIEINGNKLNCSLSKSADCWIAEFEPAPPAAPSISILFDQTVQFVQYMQRSQTLQDLCAAVAKEVQDLTGYDRVMIYRFDKDYNGEVFAECKRDDLEPFLGLHYPHTDIPPQARQLYIKNLLRLISDVNYEPVPLLTIDDGKEKNLDLSMCSLRSVSPIHIQYLQNMGVGATLTISLIYQERLWGLIACHHYSSKYIDQYTRINAQLQGHFLTSQIGMRQTAEEYVVAENVNASLKKLLDHNYAVNRFSLSAIVNRPELLSICNASGVAIIFDGVIYKNGQTPSAENIRAISAWASKRDDKQLYHTSKLIDGLPIVTDCSSTAGIIFCSLSSLTEASITWYIPETREEVHWGGDPEKAIVRDEKGLHPRKSFETWKQVINCQSRPWLKPEISAAANFSHALQQHITLVLLEEETLRQRALSEELKETNAELENINWISTHDLQEPLRKIQMFSSKLMRQRDDNSNDTMLTVQKMNESASKMQQLIEDLMAYGRLRQSQGTFENVDPAPILEGIKQDLKEEIDSSGASIVVKLPLPHLKGVPVLLRQLLVNIISNAIKFRKPHVPLIINIDSSITDDPEGGSKKFHCITIQDNGIGFDNKYREDMFKIFVRIQSTTDMPKGSGVGLAVCKKIMQIHQGYISAEGSSEGAIFNLFFPAD